ncbi:hypothetical protein G9G63_04265 [Paenibacillus sp. EKM202P]|uniref:hypothetical protein n=1 Tax=unclassified Paenibacillus TaxID=185978 RepID=UPI0013EA6685|nr:MULTISPECIES: hypothetical protein [unclassified Paenibacillus]KAF6565671.1 hypothetical protein G9G64_20740 [Paenibacillus sp. EKM207P]KAF6566613.1 hypothetical protein G9G63_04265 [Paenibacillus sp. EKM202P]
MNKLNSITATVAALSILLGTAPVAMAQQPATAATTAPNAQTSVNLDPAVTKRLTDVLNTLAGKQTIEFTSADNASDAWTVYGTLKGTANADFSQDYDSKKGIVQSTSIIYNAADMDKVMAPNLRSKVASFLKTFDTDKVFKTEALWRVYSPIDEGGFKNYWVLWGQNQSLYIHLDQGNKITASFLYSLKDVRAALINKANRSLKTLGITTKPFEYTLRQQENNDTVWHFRDENDTNSVQIGIKTGKVWAVKNEHGMDWDGDKDFARAFAKPKLSKNQALSAAKSKVQSLFGVNLKGYTVQIKKNEYTFLKKGAATVVGKINKKGVFYSLEAIPANGIRN